MTASASVLVSDSPDRAPRPAAEVVLVVGEVPRAGQIRIVSNETMHFAGIEEVCADMIRVLAPGVILSPLVAGTFDCLDLAQILRDAGYRGAYRAIAPALPAPQLIRHEVGALCPGLDFDLIDSAQI